MDRQTMADTLQRGAVPVAHTYMGPDHPMYPQIESQLVKYEFDPRKTIQMIEGLGYRRGAEGMFLDGSGQRLSVEARTTPGDLYDKILEAVRDNWQVAGVAAEIISIPRQRQSDLEYRATRPGLELTRRGTNLTNLSSFHGRQTPLAETRWIGSNVPRYQNGEFDALIDKYFVTVAIPERTQVVGQIMRHISEQLNMMHIFYDSEPALISNRIVEAHGRGSESTQTWNVHLWDVR
jgi:peptide/nickel transport system substrate-binding protein